MKLGWAGLWQRSEMGKCCLCCADLARVLKRSFVRATWEIRTCDRVTGPEWGACRKRGRSTESVVETVRLPRYLLVCVWRVCFITRFLFSTNCSTQTSTHNINLVLLLLMNYVLFCFFLAQRLLRCGLQMVLLDVARQHVARMKPWCLSLVITWCMT